MPPRYINFHGYKKEFARQTREEIDPWSATWLDRSHIAGDKCKWIMGDPAYQSWLADLPGEVDGYDFKAWTNIFNNKFNFEMTKLF